MVLNVMVDVKPSAILGVGGAPQRRLAPEHTNGFHFAAKNILNGNSAGPQGQNQATIHSTIQQSARKLEKHVQKTQKSLTFDFCESDTINNNSRDDSLNSGNYPDSCEPDLPDLNRNLDGIAHLIQRHCENFGAGQSYETHEERNQNSLEFIEEDDDVSNGTENCVYKMERAHSQPPHFEAPSYSCPLKTPSFEALKRAVLKLYRLDDFETESLAHGFFSTVYLAHHKVSGDTLVLKRNTQEHNQPNVLREIELLNLLGNHSKSAHHIVQFKGVAVDRGRLHILTEYCSEGSLETLLLGDPLKQLSWKCRVNMAWEIARGMSHVNVLGYMHRDLTARNILIKHDSKQNYHAVVGDFGLACRRPEVGGKRTETVGTPYYMAPEMINESEYDQKADVFSYGIILCQMIARIDADPDVMPRTKCFGLDYPRFAEKCDEDTQTDLLTLAFKCCLYDSSERPSFDEASELAFSACCKSTSAVKRRNNKWNTQVCHVPAPSADKTQVRRSCSEAELCSPADTVPYSNPNHMAKLAMTIAQNDRFYQPGEFTNPFARHERLKDVRKVLFTVNNGTNRPDGDVDDVTSCDGSASTSGHSQLTDTDQFTDDGLDTIGQPLESTPKKVCDIRRSHSLPASTLISKPQVRRPKKGAAEIAETFHEKDEQCKRQSSKNWLHSANNKTYNFDERKSHILVSTTEQSSTAAHLTTKISANGASDGFTLDNIEQNNKFDNNGGMLCTANKKYNLCNII